jgi:hypothetical protein
VKFGVDRQTWLGKKSRCSRAFDARRAALDLMILMFVCVPSMLCFALNPRAVAVGEIRGAIVSCAARFHATACAKRVGDCCDARIAINSIDFACCRRVQSCVAAPFG